MRSVPDRYQDRSLEGFDATVSPSAATALASARRVAAGEARSLVLVGPPGVGKTHLMAGIFHATRDRLMAAWLEARAAGHAEMRHVPEPAWPEWCSVPELVVDLRTEMGTDLHAASDRAARLRSWPALLVLDDLGREKVSDWTGELVYTLVNARYEAMLTTVASSNMTPADLATSGYWPVISRLAEDGELVEIKAPDHRLRRRAA